MLHRKTRLFVFNVQVLCLEAIVVAYSRHAFAKTQYMVTKKGCCSGVSL